MYRNVSLYVLPSPFNVKYLFAESSHYLSNLKGISVTSQNVLNCQYIICPYQQLSIYCTYIYVVCRVNEYVHPSLGECAACPTNSTSAGGTPSMCTCNAGTGRVNESDVTHPCLGECH